MRRRWVILVLALVAVALVAAWALKVFSPPKPEPVFAGQTVRQWLMGGEFRTNQAAVKLAVTALGKKSVPEIRRMLRSGAAWQRVYYSRVPLWLYRKLLFGVDQFETKDRAMWALGELAKDGKEATPELLTIAQDRTEHPSQRLRAISTLSNIRAEDTKVLPVLDKLTNDAVIGKEAAYAARSRRSEAQHFVAHEWRAIARTHSGVTNTAKPEFRPSTSFLNSTSLWDDEWTRSRLSRLNTNTTLLPARQR